MTRKKSDTVHFEYQGKYMCAEYLDPAPEKMTRDKSKLTCKNCKKMLIDTTVNMNPTKKAPKKEQIPYMKTLPDLYSCHTATEVWMPLKEVKDDLLAWFAGGAFFFMLMMLMMQITSNALYLMVILFCEVYMLLMPFRIMMWKRKRLT